MHRPQRDNPDPNTYPNPNPNPNPNLKVHGLNETASALLGKSNRPLTTAQPLALALALTRTLALTLTPFLTPTPTLTLTLQEAFEALVMCDFTPRRDR